MWLVGASLLGTFVWDRLCLYLFAPDVWSAIVEEAKATRPADLLPALYSLAKVLGTLVVLGSGNLVFMGFAYLAYKQLNKAQPAAAAAAAAR